jgi:hypothetical protein
MTLPDPIDQLGERLFQAARREPLPHEGMERALLAARAELAAPRGKLILLSRPARWTLIAAAAAALAAGVTLFARHKDPIDRISAEPASTLQRAHSAQAPSASAIALTAAPNPAPSTKPAPIFSAAPPAHSAQASLSDELGALKRASSALNAGDTSGALSALDQYDHVLKGTKMRSEATLLRIETLSRAGQAGAASELAQRFVAQNPESPLVDRARSFVQQ